MANPKETSPVIPETKMPNRLRPKSKKLKEPKELIVGSVTADLEVPTASDIVFREVWQIRKFHRTIAKRDFVDSPIFRCCVNGLATYWNVSIRFWKGPNGKKITNPVVICLNLTSCETEETGQARVRFQFGVWDASIRHWESCPISDVVFNLNNAQELLSVGYKSLGILDRHIDNAKDVSIMVKIQIIQAEEERHSLSQDLARVLAKDADSGSFVDTLVECAADVVFNEEDVDSLTDSITKLPLADSEETLTNINDNDNKQRTPSEKSASLKRNTTMIIRSHSFIIKTRSMILGAMLRNHTEEDNKNIRYTLDLRDVQHSVARELFRYLYTDKVEGSEAVASRLLPVASRYGIIGLQALCERYLVDSLTPDNVGNVLLLADQCGCETLRKAALQYCEDSETIKGSVAIGKTLAWRVMEMVNPDLFLEACESIASSSSNIDTPGSYSD